MRKRQEEKKLGGGGGGIKKKRRRNAAFHLADPTNVGGVTSHIKREREKKKTVLIGDCPNSSEHQHFKVQLFCLCSNEHHDFAGQLLGRECLNTGHCLGFSQPLCVQHKRGSGFQPGQVHAQSQETGPVFARSRKCECFVLASVVSVLLVWVVFWVTT